MLNLALFLHNLMRWLVVLAGLWAVGRALRGWLGQRPANAADATAARLFTIGFDIQFLIGLFTAAVSPLVRAAVQDPAAIGASDSVRYFALEHIPVMVVALGLAHATSVLARRADTDTDRHRRSAIGFGVSLLLIVAATPWWRPLLPGL